MIFHPERLPKLLMTMPIELGSRWLTRVLRRVAVFWLRRTVGMMLIELRLRGGGALLAPFLCPCLRLRRSQRRAKSHRLRRGAVIVPSYAPDPGRCMVRNDVSSTVRTGSARSLPRVQIGQHPLRHAIRMKSVAAISRDDATDITVTKAIALGERA